MSHESSPTGVTPAALEKLTRLLQDEMNAEPPIELRQVTDGSNRRTHLVATDRLGERHGLKAVSVNKSLITGELFSADRILLLADLSNLLEAPVPLQCVKLQPIEGLGPLSERDVVVRRWHGVRLDRLDPAEADRLRRAPVNFLRQYGEWFAFGLLFGLYDGKAKNWSWRAEDESLGRFDLEACFYPPTVPAQLADGLRPFGFRPKLLDGEEPEVSAFAGGIEAMLERFDERRDAVQSLASKHDFSRSFLDEWEWAKKPRDEFVADAIRGIPRT